MLRHQQALFMAYIGSTKMHRTKYTRMEKNVIYRNRKREPGGTRGTMR